MAKSFSKMYILIIFGHFFWKHFYYNNFFFAWFSSTPTGIGLRELWSCFFFLYLQSIRSGANEIINDNWWALPFLVKKVCQTVFFFVSNTWERRGACLCRIFRRAWLCWSRVWTRWFRVGRTWWGCRGGIRNLLG